MTYTFKLSRRLALAQITGMLAPLALLLACSSSDLTDSSPNSTDTPPALTDLFVSPRSIVLEPNQPFAIASLRRVSADAETEWSASGGTITDDGVFTATESGTYKVAGKGRGKGRRDTTTVIVTPTNPMLADLTVSPDPTSLSTTQSHIFTAKGVLSDGSVVETAVTWNATGGSIDAGGLYTAGPASGQYLVVAQSVSASIADTAIVTIQTSESPETPPPPPPPPPPTVTALSLSPANVSMETGQARQFAATVQLSDGSTTTIPVVFRATGGTVTANGLYTAGSTAGTFRVIATDSAGSVGDTSAVTVTAPAPPPPPPPPSSGQTFFAATAETGNMNAWSLPWGLVQYQGTASATQSRMRAGSWGYKYEVTSSVNATVGHDVRTMTGTPQASMGSGNGRYTSGYYSFYAYIDAGYTAPGWNLTLGWMTGVTGAPSPISNIGIENRNGVTQLMYQLKNAAVGAYTAPTIPGYTMASNGWYYMNSSSPAGIKPFPRNQWVHVSVYYKMSPSNGQVTIWQDGVKIMDLTAPTMNTFGGSSYDVLTNTAGDMILQFGIYGGAKSDGVQRLFVDDFKVTDYRPTP